MAATAAMESARLTWPPQMQRLPRKVQCLARIPAKIHRVFNLEQCELPQGVLDKLPRMETHEHDPIEAAERIIAAMPNPPEIQHRAQRPKHSGPRILSRIAEIARGCGFIHSVLR